MQWSEVQFSEPFRTYTAYVRIIGLTRKEPTSAHHKTLVFYSNVKKYQISVQVDVN